MVNQAEKSIAVLGISAYFHDSAAALVIDGKIVAAAQEERFTRTKQDASFPHEAVKYCISEAGLSVSELDAVVFYDKPLLKFERLLETYLIFMPRGLRSFVSSTTVWIKEKLFLKSMLLKELRAIGPFDTKSQKLLFTEHHLSHAASAFYPSPFSEAAVVTIDGVGEWATTTIGKGSGADLSIVEEMHFPHSVGLLYSAFTYFLGFKVNSGEYKLMGLAPYGDPASPDIERYMDLIQEHIVQIHADGSIVLNQDYFDYAVGLKMIREEKWERLFGMKTRGPKDEMTQEHSNLALAIQRVTDEIVLRIARRAKEVTGAHYLCLAGGVALNCVSNSRVLQAKLFKDIWIQPAAGDAGGALGAALAAHYIYFGSQRNIAQKSDSMQGAYLGPAFSDDEALGRVKQFKAVSKRYRSDDELYKDVAHRIATGHVVGWFQGRMEWGPRALGNRSILADPRDREMQKRLNLKIKYRESFRPFAGSVLREDAADYFEYDGDAPYMLLVSDVLTKRRNPLPPGYHALPSREKLYFVRSDIPSVTHLDYSCRHQTVHKDTNPQYWGLIDAFKRETGYSIVVNTSFNVRGEPIVCTPEDAYRCFMNTDMDTLVIGRLVFSKEEQPPFPKRDYEKEAYAED